MFYRSLRIRFGPSKVFHSHDGVASSAKRWDGFHHPGDLRGVLSDLWEAYPIGFTGETTPTAWILRFWIWHGLEMSVLGPGVQVKNSCRVHGVHDWCPHDSFRGNSEVKGVPQASIGWFISWKIPI